MFFDEKKNIRAFYLHGTHEVDIFRTADGKYDIPNEVYIDHLSVFFEKSNGMIEPVDLSDVEGKITTDPSSA